MSELPSLEIVLEPTDPVDGSADLTVVHWVRATPARDALVRTRDRLERRTRWTFAWVVTELGASGQEVRRRPLVECHVAMSDREVRSFLAAAGRVETRHLRAEPDAPVLLDDGLEGIRYPASLSLPWSYPSLPLWLIVRPWSSDRSVLGLSLRNRRRWHYPRRYYAACHRALNDLRAQLVPPSG